MADSGVRNQSLDHFVAMDSLISLEESFTKAVMQLENSHTYDTDRIIQCVELSKEACLQAISKINTTQMEGNDTASDKAKVRSLSEEIKLLEIKLKAERSKAEIATAQYEESLKHEKTMLSETRSELQKMIVSSNTEADFNAERLKEKNSEIGNLQTLVQDLTVKLNRANDEILSLKLQLSTAFEHNLSKLLQQESPSDSKPCVLLIGTSNIKGINENKLTQAANVRKVVKYTMADTMEYIRSSTENPNVVVLHCLTNDLKHGDPQSCVGTLENVVGLIQSRWNLAKIVISLATPRSDSIVHHTNGQIINALFKQKVNSEDSIWYCEHSNMLQNGNPNPDLLSEDRYHLSQKGISFLASNLKKTIHDALGIPLPSINRDRSRSRMRRRWGREPHKDKP